MIEAIFRIDSVSLWLQFAATIGTFLSMWKMGDRSIAGPILGLASQAPWLALILWDGLFGLLPITAAMVFVHGRNLRKWSRT